MGACEKYFGCLNGDVDWKAVIKALSVEDSDGNDFINVCYTDRAKCSYESAFECLQDATFRDVLELIVGEDECGRPNINILANICEACTEQIR